jgi:hypothetical protein
VPRVIPEGFVPIGVRIGPSIALALGPNAFIIPSVGVGGIGAVGSGGVAGTGSFYLGASGVVARGTVGLRAGVTWLSPPDAGESLWLVEIGVMHVPLPRSTK